MSCCGKGREQLSEQFQPIATQRPMDGPPARPAPRFAIEFEYTGSTGLTVEGPVTGHIYRFESTGSRVAIDVRDMTSMERVPVLRRLG